MADIVVKGTAFSTDGVTGDVYFRTDSDLNQWYTYDGTRWFSEQVYESALNKALSTDGFASFGGRIEEANIYIEDFDVTSYVATTNDGSHYWTFTLRSHDSAYTSGSNTTITASINTSSDSPDVFVSHDADVTISAATPANRGMFSVYGAATGTPGQLTILGNVRYRKVKT